MKTSLFPLYVRSILLFALVASCQKNQTAPVSPVQPTVTAPVITTILPASGPYQTTVTIYGSDFNQTASKDTVLFNGMAGTVISATAYQLQVSVPLGAGTGNVTVRANGLVSNGQTFTYQPGLIVTRLAGSYGNGIGKSVNGTGASASFNWPQGIGVDAAGNVYVCESASNLIRKINSAGVVTTLAGSGAKGSADGTGTSASFNNPYALATDAQGNSYVADAGNNLIRKVSPTGVVTTLAGSGNAGSANGTGALASFYNPLGIAVDGSGNVYVSDTGNAKIRKITPDGVVTTYFPLVNAPLGIAVDATGSNVYVGNAYGVLEKISSSGVRLIYETKDNGLPGFGLGGPPIIFDQLYGLALDASGNLYLVDANKGLVQKVIQDGELVTLAGGGSGILAGGISGSVVNHTDPMLAANTTRLGAPMGLTVNAAGIIYVADTQDFMILKIFIE